VCSRSKKEYDSHEIHCHNQEDFNFGSGSETKYGTLPEMIHRKTLVLSAENYSPKVEEAGGKWCFN